VNIIFSPYFSEFDILTEKMTTNMKKNLGLNDGMSSLRAAQFDASKQQSGFPNILIAMY